MATKLGESLKSDWPVSGIPKLTNFGQKLLDDCQKIQKPIVDEEKNLKDIIKNSSEFPIKFPIESCKVSNQPTDRFHHMEKQAASAYPLIHERVLWLYLKFIEHKSVYGNRVEKEVYNNMTLPNFVQRLLDKRAVSFVDACDEFLLLSGDTGFDGFDEIGTEAEIAPLLLINCLSYDEIKLSALLSVSSHSEFLNDGNRANCGVIEKNKFKIERSGVIMGYIGARLTRPFQMEYQDIIINQMQNITENGYGSHSPRSNSDSITKKSDLRKIWNQFYDEKDFLFLSVPKDRKRFVRIGENGAIFDNLIMKKRYSISFDTLLLESESRAANENKMAYIHVAGIGLGAWRVAPQQEPIFLETFEERIKALLPRLQHIAFIHFSWFNMESGDIKNGGCIKSEAHPEGIRILVSRRNPADKLEGPEFENTLLIVSYAWDGNALPGNEFWFDSLMSSNDPSTACSTLVTELHNAHINKKFANGENLHIASMEYGVIHIADYAKKIQQCCIAETTISEEGRK